MTRTIYSLLLLLLVPRLIASPAEDREKSTVEIFSFSAARIQNLITLNWNTVGEINNLGFEIERRSQFDSHWHTVAYVRGRGTAHVGQRYSFVEKMDEHAVLFYRLKQIDQSGKSMYTQAVTVTPDVFPTSMKLQRRRGALQYNQVSFALPADGTVRVTVHDVFGREVSTITQERHMQPGYHVLPFSSSTLPDGIYSVRLETENGTLVETLVMNS